MELERKFLVKKLPELDKKSKVEYERYYIDDFIKNQIRVQKKNGKIYEYETKFLQRDKFVNKLTPITQGEFLGMTKKNKKKIVRENYKPVGMENVSVAIYKGAHEGLIRAEFRFATVTEAIAFNPPAWVGREITSTPLALDAHINKLSREEFVTELQKTDC